MKNGKSPGMCEIQVELLKAGGINLMKWMQMVFNMVMRFGKAQGIGGEQWSFPLKQSQVREGLVRAIQSCMWSVRRE